MNKEKIYTTPIFHQEDLHDKEVQHRVNFFGEKWMYSIKERIWHILDLNNTVLCENCNFNEDILDLLDKPLEDLLINDNIQISEDNLKDKHIENLPKHLLRTDPTIHHIIFQNQCLWWHVRNDANRIEMDRWVHTSFHELLDNKNLYPHQQLIKITRLEKETINPCVYNTLQEIQVYYNNIFIKDPTKIYKKEAFKEVFFRKNLSS